MRKIIFAITIIYAFILFGCTATFSDLIPESQSTPKKIIVSSIDLRREYEVLGVVSVRYPVAWIFYNHGDFSGAKEWLGLVNKESPLAEWIESKLLLREG